MRVKIYDCDNGNETLRGVAWLRDCLPDDDEYRRAHGELQRSGRVWVAGGAAPLVLLMKLDGGHPIVDDTPIGPQLVIPGAERLTQAELARRQAAAPMRPDKAQKPCDVGLFGDDAAQIDLVDMLRNR